MVYLQQTEYTTAACSLLNITSKVKGEEVSIDDELNLWKKTINPPLRASNIYGLALEAINEGLEVEIYVENKDLDFPDYRFYRYKKEDIELSKEMNKYFLKELEEKKKVKEETITFEKVKSLLKNNYLLLRLNTKPIRENKRNNSNYLAILNYENGFFEIIDPIQGVLNIEESKIMEGFIGLETKKHRSHKMLAIKKTL